MRRLMLAVLLVLTGCSSGADNGVGFTAVDLTATPEALATHADMLVIGTRPSDHPELVTRTKDGTLTNVRLTPTTPYGKEAHWYGITSDGTTITGVGGERGGAHGNVRWSAWTGDTRQIVEKTQAFSTFGGYGAGELIGVVRTAQGPRIIGTWQSAKAGLDIAAWTYAEDTWTRQPSAGTALESSQDLLRFPLAVTQNGDGALVAGWQIAKGTVGAAVWQFDGTTWTTATLPDGDAALAARCWDGTCHVVGRAKGKLAWWTGSGSDWRKLTTPDIPVGDDAVLAAPVPVNGTPTLFVDHNGVKLVSGKDERPADGPSGEVVAAEKADDQVFVIAGGRLWRLS
ncbi:hypothetical protein SK803_10385 [Lentzea sp. BCCO 10_0856]|uniref:Uncharacterized protein n=1 Tax=Lentzea miocenica TaxID=3095431 RepID=A0ABU4SXH3_9PSEU|nr:hypothetical protein [Lentzea sp. BCCO 10_0856]MDX8030620.1 hypothetical protein [Lentzea sp. BCCO 10_0856]